jgi:hypothetical protein
MRRAFDFDVLACVRCGGRMRLLATIEQGDVIRRILSHLGLPIELPPLGVARGALSRRRRATPRPPRAPPLDSVDVWERQHRGTAAASAAQRDDSEWEPPVYQLL